ncbi:MAG TPA: endonuclease NucS domain-containing protein [Rhodopila sp.]
MLTAGLQREEVAAGLGRTSGRIASPGDVENKGSRIVNQGSGQGSGLQCDLLRSLRRSIARLEPGLTIIDGNRDQTIPSRRSGIVARDPQGEIVVIELNDGRADSDAIGQSLAQMGDLMTEDTPVRGILVARDFTPSAILAARAVPNLRLVQYGFRFVFEPVALSPP